MATDHNAIGWAGYSLGQKGDSSTRIKVLGIDAGVQGFDVGRPGTTVTASTNGGGIAGRSVAPPRTIVIPKMLTSSRSQVRAFMATMNPTNDEAMLEMHGLLWADDDDPNNPAKGEHVCVYAVPQGVVPAIDSNATGVDAWHLLDATWLAADPTIYSYPGPPVQSLTPANSHALTFTNAGTLRTRAGRAWTIEITAHSNIRSPWIQLYGQRVEWTGLGMSAGQKLIVDRHRHSYVGSLGVDGWARTGASRFLDYPTLKPGSNPFTAGCLTGTVTAKLTARSTW